MRTPRFFLPILLILLSPCSLSAAPGDSDNDGLRDAVETETGVFISADDTGTNPNLADSDGDSMPDGMEVQFCTNPIDTTSKLTRPNIIYILADDFGYGDVGCFWQNQRTAPMKSATPGLDAMATQGAMLTHHYVGAPICSASRACFLQGRHSGHADIRDGMFDSPLPDRYSLPAMLKSAGYRTIHIGKAGLTGRNPDNPVAHPLDRGFDRFLGYLTHDYAHEHYPRNGNNPNKARISDDRQFITDAWPDVFTSDLYTAFAKKTIIEEASQSRPFFLYLSFDSPHFLAQFPPSSTYPSGLGLSGGIQWTGAPSYTNTSINNIANVDNPANRHPSTSSSWILAVQQWISMIRRMDDSIADILKTVRDLGIENNTLIVFTSDNGPADVPVYPPFFESYGPFEGIKGDLLEGGIRVPTIAWWPGTINGSNEPLNIKRIDRPMANYDWLATFADLARCPIPYYTDGTSLASTLTGQGTQLNRGFNYFEMYSYAPTPAYTEFTYHSSRPRGWMQAIRLGDFMGLRTSITSADNPFMIFNVVADPKQGINLATSRPDLQQKMMRLSVGARRPLSTNPRPYDSAQIPPYVPQVAVRNGLKWKSYEGYWPWLPDLRTLPPINVGERAGISTSVRCRENDFGISFEGYVNIATAGAYTFQINSNSGASLWVHEAHVIDNDTQYAPAKTSATVNLKTGLHPIRLFYRHQGGTPSLDLRYAGPGITMTPIPESVFFQDGQPTILQPDKLVTSKGAAVTADVLANDTAENPLILENLGAPQQGTAAITEGKAHYTPPASYLGSDEFSYTVFDGIARSSSSVAVKVLFDNEIWWPLDEGAGTNVGAYGTPSPLTGNLSGSASPPQSWVTGKLGRAIRFDGVDDQVTFPAMPLPSGSAARSLSCWVKTINASLTENQTLFTYGTGAEGQRFTLRLSRGASPESLVAAVEALPGSVVGSKILNDGRWHHLAVVVADHDGNGVTDINETRIYVDGVPDVISSSTSSLLNTASATSVCLGGSDQSSSSHFNGSLDDVRMFPGALSASEVSDLWNQTMATALMHGMPPNDSDGDGIRDSAEEIAGTDPEDSTSFFRIKSSSMTGSGLSLQWAGVAGRTYRVEESSDLKGWSLVPGVASIVVTENTPSAAVTVPPNGAAKRFVRIQAMMTP